MTGQVRYETVFVMAACIYIDDGMGRRLRQPVTVLEAASGGFPAAVVPQVELSAVPVVSGGGFLVRDDAMGKRYRQPVTVVTPSENGIPALVLPQVYLAAPSV